MKTVFAIVTALLLVSCSRQDGPVAYPATADPTGCLIEQVTSAPYDEYQVQGVSADGKRLAYSSRRGEDAAGNQLLESYILDLESGETTPLPAAINNSGAFSPDGEYLVAAAYVDSGTTDILELHIASGEITTIAPHEQWDWLPSYSADGKYIVFNSHRNGDQADIYVYERATQELQRLTDYPGYDAHAQFSPDVSQVLFHRMIKQRDDDRYNFDLYVYDRSTGTETRLTDSPYEESYGAYAPDGKHIVFSSDADEAPEKHNLYLRSPDGFITELTDGPWEDRYAYWTREGDYIYFNSDRAGVTNVHRIPMRGTSCVVADST